MESTMEALGAGLLEPAIETVGASFVHMLLKRLQACETEIDSLRTYTARLEKNICDAATNLHPWNPEYILRDAMQRLMQEDDSFELYLHYLPKVAGKFLEGQHSSTLEVTYRKWYDENFQLVWGDPAPVNLPKKSFKPGEIDDLRILQKLIESVDGHALAYIYLDDQCRWSHREKPKDVIIY
ncbi:hypothetical protein WJX74_001188 [Apatococcus lobatus]|uniref:Rx N-terminal domain-containing protein n=1 Tax=Apatococcus lobatus TaxID=904363 RepID=A0AAW1RKU2_9CHLO